MFKAILAKLAVRQMSALMAIPGQLSKAVTLFFTLKLKAFFAAVLAVFQLFGVILFDTPGPIIGDEINLNDYSLVFSDEFNGDSLDTDVWQDVPGLGTGEIFDRSMLSFDGENLIMSTEYLEDGPKGAGWYTGGIENTEAYSNFKPGCYFECRCIVPSAKGMWSAFWMMTSGERNYRNGRHMEYTEIDVMESFYYGQKHQNSTINTVHKYQPETDNFKSEIVGKYRINKDKDIYKIILEGYILTPRLVGKRVGLHPLWILFAVLAGGCLAGFLGVLVAVPIAAIIGVVLRWLNKFYQSTSFYKGGK